MPPTATTKRPRTQSALLQAMQEQEVTVAGLWLLGRQLGLCDDYPNE